MAFAYGTSITTPNGSTAIEKLNINDTASAWTPDEVVPTVIVFSSGSPGGYPAGGIAFLEIGDNDLIVTQDQPIVLAGGKIKMAGQLIPQRDHLLQADGQPVMLNMLSLGQWSGGLHSVVVDQLTDAGNHYIIANGIVCGDFLIERMPSPYDEDDTPFLGEEEHK
ncbi:hypothetical protein ACFQZI_02095 [Mucilaginibacter lutimaris]|uniref:Hedgehog/Intein (Hint) domain-containing protein n=1 Tax=Mucilaginibacter lutimaris TaxID=931629 RepID=A0ABW2ZBJ8_9SPHI